MYCEDCKKEVSVIKNEIDKYGKTLTYFSCRHIFAQTNIPDQGKAHELAGIKKKGQKRFSKKYKFYSEVIFGEKFGKDGNLVFINRITDRANDFYKEVVQQGENILRDVEEKLSEHFSRHK